MLINIKCNIVHTAFRALNSLKKPLQKATNNNFESNSKIHLDEIMTEMSLEESIWIS